MKHLNKVLQAVVVICFIATATQSVFAADINKRLLVIAPNSFHAALKEFIAYKSKQLPTELVSLETVLKNRQGVDDPEKLKHYLYDEWHTRNAGYALLVGEADLFPVRYIVLDRKTPAAFDCAFYPCDLYYSCLAKTDGTFDDWNAQKDGYHAGYFGEVHGEANKTGPINFDEISYHPNIAVGRWPVSTVEQLTRVAAKSMRYEQGAANGTVPSAHTAAFFAVGGWVDCRPLLDHLAGEMPAGWSVTKRYYKDADRSDDTPPPTEAQVDQVLNDGAGLVCHTGHGNDDQWYKCFYMGHLNRVNNADRLPVMVSIGCSTARFATLPPYEPYVDVNGKAHAGSDNKEVFTAPPPPPACYQSGKYDPNGLGKELVRGSDSGAVAYIGCNTGSQPCATSLLSGFIDALQKAPAPRLGDCWASAIDYYYDHEHLATIKSDAGWYPPTIFFQGMKYMLYGDPSLQMPKPEKKT